jgi:hypothetical protein
MKREGNNRLDKAAAVDSYNNIVGDAKIDRANNFAITINKDNA